MKYTKKPITIDALQYTGDNVYEIESFVGRNNCYMKYDPRQLIIITLEGEHIASVNDFIIKGVKGEFYPCKPDIFELTYDS